MSLNIYLTFEDNCNDAFEFYRSIFGGEFLTHSTFNEIPEGMDIPEDERERIMHVSLPIGNSILMGSDKPSSYGLPLNAGNNFAINFEAENRSHADEIFAKLSDGGTVIMPLEDAFWGSYYGKCCDKFGINWQVLADHADQ